MPAMTLNSNRNYKRRQNRVCDIYKATELLYFGLPKPWRHRFREFGCAITKMEFVQVHFVIFDFHF